MMRDAITTIDSEAPPAPPSRWGGVLTKSRAMKDVWRNLLHRLHGESAKARIGDLAEPDSSTSTPEWLPTGSPTGETIYGDRPLRFQALTLSAAELEQLEDPAAFQGGFKIRIARRAGGRRHSGNLVEKRYASRGYATPVAAPDPHLFTFSAYDEGVLVGTVGVRTDSADGLSADRLYKQEIDSLRNSSCRVCEFTRLAVDKTVASKPVLAGLFHTAYLYAALLQGCTHAVIEVNPRHVTFYRKALGFVPIGVERLNERVNAPAILLAVPFQEIADGLRKYAGQPGAPGAGRSLFPYGFAKDEEAGVLNRLRQLVLASE